MTARPLMPCLRPTSICAKSSSCHSKRAGEFLRLSRRSARVLDARFANHEVSIQTEAPAPSLVVISQTHYPAWKAYVDGRSVTIWRANYAFQALEVPAGRHQIRLVYEDKKLLVGRSFRAWDCWSAPGFGSWHAPALSEQHSDQAPSSKRTQPTPVDGYGPQGNRPLGRTDRCVDTVRPATRGRQWRRSATGFHMRPILPQGAPL